MAVKRRMGEPQQLIYIWARSPEVARMIQRLESNSHKNIHNIRAAIRARREKRPLFESRLDP